jgi:hypothetical protein
LNIRRQRLAGLPDRHAVYEPELQRLEGLAEYIEYLAGGRAILDGPSISGNVRVSERGDRFYIYLKK